MFNLWLVNFFFWSWLLLIYIEGPFIPDIISFSTLCLAYCGGPSSTCWSTPGTSVVAVVSLEAVFRLALLTQHAHHHQHDHLYRQVVQHLLDLDLDCQSVSIACQVIEESQVCLTLLWRVYIYVMYFAVFWTAPWINSVLWRLLTLKTCKLYPLSWGPKHCMTLLKLKTSCGLNFFEFFWGGFSLPGFLQKSFS